jgi:hypothetical protein
MASVDIKSLIRTIPDYPTGIRPPILLSAADISK